eukprot:TRINITY_DN50751_c0_g1_i1.p1 TRINITY_DN50751_c0_g1~~TRINITY_DN50751_c0_g1_i1.p1  ORF type:complete len:1148 (+),score=270.08 TRINITY_DN50751_c0_g1_i1:398-3445(+)
MSTPDGATRSAVRRLCKVMASRHDRPASSYSRSEADCSAHRQQPLRLPSSPVLDDGESVASSRVFSRPPLQRHPSREAEHPAEAAQMRQPLREQRSAPRCSEPDCASNVSVADSDARRRGSGDPGCSVGRGPGRPPPPPERQQSSRSLHRDPGGDPPPPQPAPAGPPQPRGSQRPPRSPRARASRSSSALAPGPPPDFPVEDPAVSPRRAAPRATGSPHRAPSLRPSSPRAVGSPRKAHSQRTTSPPRRRGSPRRAPPLRPPSPRRSSPRRASRASRASSPRQVPSQAASSPRAATGASAHSRRRQRLQRLPALPQAGAAVVAGRRAASASGDRTGAVAALNREPWSGGWRAQRMRVADLVDEPVSERGRLLMLLGYGMGGALRIAFFNGHPEVELYCETWAQGLEPLGETRRSEHAEYQQPVLHTVVQPGETVEFAERTEGDGDPQPGWRTRPLRQHAFAAAKKRADQQVSEDYRRLAATVSSDAPELSVLEEAARQGLPFVDLWFLPQRSSAAREWEEQAAAEGVVAWCRAASCTGTGTRACLFAAGAPRPTDVRRGLLPDGWLLCALAALAELSADPARCPLRALFSAHRPQYQAVGAYRVTLLRDGWWREVVVDDYLPVKHARRGVSFEPAYANCAVHPPNEFEVWVPIIEKAYARLHGSYAAAAAGHFYEALGDLSGYPSRSLPWPDASDSGSALWEELCRWDADEALIVLHTPGATEDNSHGELSRRYDDNGLALGHCYAVLGVHSVDGHRLLHLRNPWPPGRQLWRGRWAQGAQSWADSPAVAAEVRVEETTDDWSLWLSWPEALDWFRGCSVCHSRPDAGELRVALPFQPGAAGFVFEVSVETPTRVFLSVHQKGPRGRRPAQVQPPGCMNVTALRQQGPDGVWERAHEGYEWGQKDFVSELDFYPEDGPQLVVVHDYDGGGTGDQSGLIHDDVVVAWHYMPRSRGGPAVQGTVTFRHATPVLSAIAFTPVVIEEALGPVEAFVQQRRHIASQPPPVGHHKASIVHL